MSIEKSKVVCVLQKFGMSEDLKMGDDEVRLMKEIDDLMVVLEVGCRLWIMDFQREMAGKVILKEFRKWDSATIMGDKRERVIFLDFPCSIIDFCLPRLAPPVLKFSTANLIGKV